MSNLDKYRDDLNNLLKEGEEVRRALIHVAYGDEYEKAVLKQHGGDKGKAAASIKALPTFKVAYQSWYSEALALVKQILPDRLGDFVRLYEKPKGRKDVGFESYRIEDALQGLVVTRGDTVIASERSAIPHLEQQLAIVASITRRFESSLFDITQLVQADLFDSELDAAKELLKNKFFRAAGAVAGVVLEKHLGQVCANHSVLVAKKHPTIADYNDMLKAASVVDIPQWRFNQHLADIRNLCDHDKSFDPSQDQVRDLIDGVAKVTKTLY